MTITEVKTWIEIISSLLTAIGVLTAAIVALFRWGPGAGPRPIIRHLIFIPPGIEKDINSKDVVIAADVIFVNPSPTPEYINDISLTIMDPEGASYKYNPFIFAESDAFFDKSQTPKWFQSLFHPLMIEGSDKNQQIAGSSKNIIFSRKKIIFLPSQANIR